jgi:acetyltransferase
MQRLKVWRILSGLRRQPAVDPEPFVAAVCSLSGLLAQYPEIAECDINPVRLAPNGTLLALDARLRIAHLE